MTATAPAPARTKIQVPHFVRGKLVWGEDNEYLSRDFGVPFVTPKIEYNELFVPRTEPGPAFDVPISEIIDFLVETAGQLSLEKNPYLQESLEMTLQVSALPRRIIENTFRRPGQFLTKKKPSNTGSNAPSEASTYSTDGSRTPIPTAASARSAPSRRDSSTCSPGTRRAPP